MKISTKNMFDIVLKRLKDFDPNEHNMSTPSKVIRNSKESPWKLDSGDYNLYNEELGVHIWVANGISFTRMKPISSSSQYCKPSLYQSFIFQYYFLRRIKNRNRLLTLLLFFLGIISIMTPLVVMSCYYQGYRNYNKKVDFKMGKSEFREQRLSKILDN